MESDLVDESFQDYDCLRVVSQVEVGDCSVPAHHVGIAEAGCSGARRAHILSMNE